MSGEKKTHNEQIEEIRKNSQPPFQPTDYMGLKVDSGIADQIARQPVSELLTFEQGAEGKTRIQVKLPEKGIDPTTGKEFSIRVNMNYFTRGMVRAVMGEDGRLDPVKAEKLDTLRGELATAVNYPPEYQDHAQVEQLSKEIIDQLGIPAEDRADFERFFHANIQDPSHSLVNGAISPISHMNQEVHKLSAYQYLQEGGPLPETYQERVDRTKWDQMRRDARPDYENICQDYVLMANMDPKEEKRILYPSDCIAFRYMTAQLLEEHNAWREKKGQEKIGFSGQDYAFNGDSDGFPPQKAPKGEDLYFYEHHLLTVPAQVDGKRVVLSLENTAPPADKLLERPAVERTGVGLFSDEHALQEFHYNVNLGVVSKEAEIKTFGSFSGNLEDDGITCTADPKHTDVWEREAAYAKEKARTGTDAEVIDSFARHLTVQSVVEGADRDHRPSYDKRVVDESVEGLKNNGSFKLMVQTYGAEKMREALASRDPQAASVQMFAPQKGKRYALDDKTKRQMLALGASMETKGRSDEWKELHAALTDPEMKDSSRIFDAVEKYTKGKKSVRKTQEGRDSFNLAMKAMAIVAKNGDPVAQQRAQNLVDRINEVRGTKAPEHKGHVSLETFAPKEPEAQKQAERQQPQVKGGGPEK